MSAKARTTAGSATRLEAQFGSNLEKNLLAYAAAAAAGLLSSAIPASAEVVYVPSNTPMAVAQTNMGPAFTNLDLNNDGVRDFTFAMSYTSLYNSSTIRHKFYLKVLPAGAGNGVIEATTTTAAALSKGQEIGPQQKFGSNGLYMALSEFNARSSQRSGSWRNVEYAYVGLKFVIKGEVHYGWARIKFPYTGSILLPGAVGYPSIYGYAYENTPNQPIIAGLTSGNAQDSSAAVPARGLGMLAAGASAGRMSSKN